jgi:hypothetical protein
MEVSLPFFPIAKGQQTHQRLFPDPSPNWPCGFGAIPLLQIRESIIDLPNTSPDINPAFAIGHILPQDARIIRPSHPYTEASFMDEANRDLLQ